MNVSNKSISIKELQIGDNQVTFGDSPLSLDETYIGDEGLRVTVFRQEGSIWEQGAQLRDRATYIVKRPKAVHSTGILDAKDNFSRSELYGLLVCESNDIKNSFISPAIDDLCLHDNSLKENNMSNLEFQLKILALNFILGGLVIYPELKVKRIAMASGDQAIIYGKVVVDPFFTVSISYEKDPFVRFKDTRAYYEISA